MPRVFRNGDVTAIALYVDFTEVGSHIWAFNIRGAYGGIPSPVDIQYYL